jgi:hypothetical protein
MQATRCKCGAVTVTINGQDYSMRGKKFKELFPGEVVPRATMYGCNFCINHWGLELCGCGSGATFGKCPMQMSECRRPAQDIDLGLTRCHCDSGGWQQ